MKDYWNYIQVLGIIFYYSAAITDVVEQNVSDNCRILYAIALLFSLFTILYLVRVFSVLSFLVKMLI